jgi:hypothetical protein
MPMANECKVCGDPIRTGRYDKETCSGRCRTKLWRQRKSKSKSRRKPGLKASKVAKAPKVPTRPKKSQAVATGRSNPLPTTGKSLLQ